MIVKDNDNDFYLLPVPPRNGAIGKKGNIVLRQIFAVPNSFFGMTNQPLHPFLPPKSTVLHY